MFTFHHVALSISDMERSKNFYSAFGFVTILDWESDDKDSCISHLKNGSIFLELFSYKKSQKLNKKNLGDDLRQIGIKHFGLKVESINKAKEKIIQAGLAKKEDVEIKQGRTGIVYFFLQDPDGNFVEIVEDNRVFNLA